MDTYRAAAITPGLRRLVEHNGRVQPGERVLVIADYPMADYAPLLAGQVRSVGAHPVVVLIPPSQGDGNEPPPAVAAAMKETDVIFSPVSRSITHTSAMRAALDAGARSILMTHHNDDVLTARSLLVTDFAEQEEKCRRIGRALEGDHQIRVTSPGGTDLTFTAVGRRKPNVLTGRPNPGELAPVPTIEVNVVPLEGTAQGVIVADCSIPYLGIGLLEEPVVCPVEDGFITEVKGGRQADVLRADWEARNDRNCYNVAELGIGLNPEAIPTGVMLEDEGILGTVHFGIGTSLTLGGDLLAPTHYDLLVWAPTVEIDGKPLLRDKELLL
ncbi:aminopeptidase [Ornithinimicrobium cavernae]|uniref:aminopeptidase n=1 Tax=Ornithinimicrobium cavernae TaxID=2666047 RepID=UPI0012B16928|nr:aminopeptidase [Ornithinimicrobium cavernae]